MQRFENKVVVVTGGSSGIGLAAARAFAAEGAHVYITGRRQHELDRAVASIGHNVSAVRADASITADLKKLYQAIEQNHGRIDVVFANAGYVEKGSLGELSEQQYIRQFDSNVKGVLFTVQLMTAGGTIVLNGSINGSKGFAGSSLYSASKAAIRSFARSWTQDLRGRGIRVNVVSPGPTETNVLEASGYAPDQVTQARNQLAKAIPLGRFMAGSEMFVDGGMAQV